MSAAFESADGPIFSQTEARIAHFSEDHATVQAANAHRLAAMLFEQIHERLVDLAGKDHLGDFDGFLIGHTQSVNEHGLLAEALHKVADLRTAAVHQHDAHADKRHQDDIAHDLLFDDIVDHRVAAVFDDDDLAVVALHERKSLRENFRALGVGELERIVHETCILLGHCSFLHSLLINAWLVRFALSEWQHRIIPARHSRSMRKHQVR